MTDAALNLNFNVTIKVLDEKGKVVDERRVHNKANRTMVNSIIQFLQGVFNPSEFNDPYEIYSNPEQAIINNAYGAKRYLPSCTGVGICGIVDSDDPAAGLARHELVINSEEQTKPNFFETSLQEEYDVPRMKFRRVRPVRGLDTNNSEGLVMTTVLPRGYLVAEYEDGEIKRDANGIVYRDKYFDYYGEDGSATTPTRAMAITEIGLFSNTSTSDGLLLARVLLDGELASGDAGKKGVMADPDYEYNPLIQTIDTSVVIEWKIGIISIGTNDEIIGISPVNIPVSNPEG